MIFSRQNVEGGLRVAKGRSFRGIARYSLVGATVWLLLVPTLGVLQASSSSINLLDPKNGGHVLVTTKESWLATIDYATPPSVLRVDDWAVYAFKNEEPAVFDAFAVLIPETGDNLKEFELLAGNDLPTGEFISIGKFTTTNLLFVQSPYQEFKFQPVTAKYLKVQILSGWHSDAPVVHKFRLFKGMRRLVGGVDHCLEAPAVRFGRAQRPPNRKDRQTRRSPEFDVQVKTLMALVS